jgi:hypothetical protein
MRSGARAEPSLGCARTRSRRHLHRAAHALTGGLPRPSSPFGWFVGHCRRRSVSSFQVSVSVRPDRRGEAGAARDAGHHSRFVPLLHRWPPRHAVWPPRSLPAGRRFLGLHPWCDRPGLGAGAVQVRCFGARQAHPACGGVARTRRPVLPAGSATPSLGVVTCASLAQPIDGWCISRVVTTGWRRVVTTRLAQRIRHCDGRRRSAVPWRRDRSVPSFRSA